jgi:hypothetical protein
VSGADGGGTALVGGNFHGSGPEPDAATTTVASGAQIIADALDDGNGGNVAIWSDDSTIFNGSITAQGGALGGNGGYVETSGAALSVAGTITTLAPHGETGTWLLDPTAITIVSGGSTTFGAGNGTITVSSGGDTTIDPSTIITELGSTNVALEVNAPAATADITVESSIIYSSSNELDLVSTGTVHFDASVQNSGSGNILVVGGWNGVTAPSSIVSSGAYGGTGGDVSIGDGSHTVAVGSANGTTTVAAENLTLQGGNFNGAYAQLGYYVSGTTTTGTIVADLTGNLVIDGGTGDTGEAEAQIGDGGEFAVGTFGGNITINVGGTVSLNGNASGTFSYAQIGNGGYGSSGNASGAISLTIADNAGTTLSLVGGANGSYALIGNGDAAQSNSGNATGDIIVQNGGTSSFSDGTALAWLGNITSATGFTSSGNVVLISAYNLAPEDEIGTFVVADLGGLSNSALVGGDVTVGMTSSATAGRIDTDISFESPHQFTALDGGSLDLSASIENGGSGALNIVVGWNGSTGLVGSTFSMTPVLAAPGVAYGRGSAALVTGGNTIETASGTITIAGAVQLNGAVSIDTTQFGDSPGADITFASTIDDSSGNAGAYALSLTAGSAGSINLGGAIGGVSPIGGLAVNSAGLVMLNGNITTAGGTVTFTTAPTTLDVSVRIDTTANGTVPGGAGVYFDSESPINSFNGTQSLTVSGGTNIVEFDASLGDDEALKSFMASGGGFLAEGDIVTSGGAVTISVNSSSEEDLSGQVLLEGNVTTAGGALTVTTSAPDPYVEFDETVTTEGGPVSVTATATSYAEIDLDGNIITTTGNVGLTAAGSDGAEVYVGPGDPPGITTGSGTITLVASGGPSGGEVYLDSGSALQTTSGAITITAEGDSAYVYLGGPIQAGGAVNVTADATGEDEDEIYLDGSEGGSISTTTSTASVTLSATSAQSYADIFAEGNITTQGASITLSATAYYEPYVELSGATVTTSGGSLTATADTTGPESEDDEPEIYIDETVTTANGNVTLTASDPSYAYIDIDSGGSVTTGSGTVSATATSATGYAEVDLDGNIITTTGNVSLTANGGDGSEVYLAADCCGITTGSGTIALLASGGSSEGELYLDSALQTTSGAITITAEGDSAYVYLYGSIQAGGAVNVTADATGEGEAYIDFDGGGITTTTAAGTVTLSATSAQSDADIYVDGNITTQGASITVSATAFEDPYIEIEEGTVATNGGAFTATAITTGPATEDDEEAVVEIDANVTTSGGNVTVATSSPNAAHTILDGTLSSAGGNVTLIATTPLSSAYAYSEVDAYNIATTSGSVSVISSGGVAGLYTGSIATEGGNVSFVALGGPYEEADPYEEVDGQVDTGGGSLLYYADGSAGLINIDRPLTLTGPSIFAAESIWIPFTLTLDPSSLALYTDSLEGANNIVGAYSLASYESFSLESSSPNGPSNSVPVQAVQGLLQSSQHSAPPQSNTNTGPTTNTGANSPPPPQNSPTTLSSSGSGSTGEVTSVTDLDQGDQLFTGILSDGGGGSVPTDPVEIIPPVKPAAQAQPIPPKGDAPLGGAGSGLYQTQTVPVRHNGVSGIENGASSEGNPALWFGAQPT